MKVLKKIAISLLIASAMGIASAPAMAESDPGRVTYKPAEAIDMVVGHVQKAIDLLIVGGEAAEVATHAKAGLDISKEINANDKVDAARSKANAKLKSAIAKLKPSDGATEDRQGAETDLRDAVKKFGDLKGLI